jgi:transcriptional regulator with XRE-family HTH domain
MAGLAVALGQVIRDRRDARGWSQARLAAKAGISRTMVSYLETGVMRNPTIGLLDQVGRALGTHVKGLLDEASERVARS